MKILAIDHGTKRIGVAVSDALGFTAVPLSILENSPHVHAQIAELLRTHSVRTLVVGRPITMSGREGEAVDRVEAFVTALIPVLPPGVNIVWVDERLTSTEASSLREKPRSKTPGSRPPKERIDDLAAALILQDYLEQINGPAELPDPDEFLY